MDKGIILFDEVGKELRKGDMLVLIRKVVDFNVDVHKYDQKATVFGSVRKPEHGRIISMEQLSDGFAEIGPLIEVTLDNGTKFNLDGENGSNEFAWYKLPE